MSRVAMVIMAAVLGALAAGCSTPSVHSIRTKEVEVSDERLLGAWRDEDGRITYTVTKADEGYRLHVGKKAEAEGERPIDAAFDLHLVKLGEHRFIDVAAAGAERRRLEESHGSFFIPTHMFARVEVEADRVTVAWLKGSVVRRAMKEGELAATPLDDSENGTVLITAETVRLHAFLKARAGDAGAWDQTTLRRVKSAPGQ